jgi:hypothetical protein
MRILRMTVVDKQPGNGVDGQIHFLRSIGQSEAIKNKCSKSLEFMNSPHKNRWFLIAI